jgi:RND superfamily putative drug exporter
MQTMMKAMYSTFTGLIIESERMTDTASAMDQAFDSPDFQWGLKLMLSPDGRSPRFIVTHDVDPATPEGISHADAEMQAVRIRPMRTAPTPAALPTGAPV